MTLTIKTKISAVELKKAIQKLLLGTKKTSLKKYFGSAVDKIDAIEFQKNSRNEWD